MREENEKVNKAQSFLSDDDEQMLQMFFAEHQEEIPDDGFSQRVMEHLPNASQRRLERWWQVICLVMGVAIIASSQWMASLRDSLFVSKVAGMMLLSKWACHFAEILAQPQQLLMVMASIVLVLCVWGYNKVLDARI